MRINCEHCGGKLTVTKELAGRKGRCPKCRKVFRIGPPEQTGQAALAQLAAGEAPTTSDA
jgi:predicted Zn finger-like uncharacterized protein